MEREKLVKKYGIEVVENDEAVWKKRGYKINYNTGLLEKIKTDYGKVTVNALRRMK